MAASALVARKMAKAPAVLISCRVSSMVRAGLAGAVEAPCWPSGLVKSQGRPYINLEVSI
jgi:hypothetical protein